MCNLKHFYKYVFIRQSKFELKYSVELFLNNKIEIYKYKKIEMSIKPSICNAKTEKQPVCLPNNETVWYQNTWNLVTWELTGLLYINYEHLNLYFYYQKNYNFYKTLDFKNINKGNGYFSLLVNDSFFPTCEQNKNWNYSLLLLGNDTNPDDVINNKLTKWNRVDFNIIQNSSCINNNLNSTNITNISNPQNSESDNNDVINKKFETWKIIIIAICCLLFIIISAILVRLTFIKKRNKKNNEFNEIIEDKILNKVIYIKPDDIVKYEKPNSY